MSQEIETLNRVVAGLRPEVVRQVIDFALFLRTRQEAPVDYSDEWTEEDEGDFSKATWQRLDEQEPWEGPGNASAG